MSGTPGKLSYGEAPARLPWKRAVLLPSAGLLLAAISRILVPKLQTWYRGPFMVHRAVGLCLQWSQPAGRIDYEEDPTLAAVDPAYAGFTINKFGKIVGFSANPPDALLPVLFSKSGLNLNAVSNDLVFLHSVRSPTGHERLVYIAVNKFFAFRPVNGDVPRDWPSDMLDCLVIDPGSWTTPPTLLSQSSWCDRVCNSRMPFPSRLQAGQLDHKDPSRIAILCQTPDGTTTIACRLEADDSLSFARSLSKPKP